MPNSNKAKDLLNRLTDALARRFMKYSPTYRVVDQKLIDSLLTLDATERVKLLTSFSHQNFAVGGSNYQIRTQWLEKTLAGIPAGRRLLDAGAGERQYRRFCQHLDYVSQDINEYTGEGEVGLQTGAWDTSGIDIVSDIVSIPEADGSFDVILCTEVLEHVQDPVAALRELSRLLKIGGTLIVTAPFNSLTHFAPYHFATGFSRFFYQKHLELLGFEILELVENGNYFEYIAQEVRRIDETVRQYSAEQPTQAERMSMQMVMAMLERFSMADRGSKELLHFGCHVIATKVSNP